MEISRFIYLDWRVVLVGSNANNSGKAGVFSLNANNTWSNDNANIASHLCLQFKNTFFKYINPASWQNTKQSLIQFSRLILETLEVK
jgi:hypothetical protein